jgi:hypothetical protein
MEIQTVSATMEDAVSKLRAEIATVHENVQEESEARAVCERLLGEKHEQLLQWQTNMERVKEELHESRRLQKELSQRLETMQVSYALQVSQLNEELQGSRLAQKETARRSDDMQESYESQIVQVRSVCPSSLFCP